MMNLIYIYIYIYIINLCMKECILQNYSIKKETWETCPMSFLFKNKKLI
jgi:hypothetical protein